MARAKGRHWVALWLVAFLVTTWWVYARQTAAIRAARELGDLRGRRANLDGHRADLERRIRAAESRAVLVRAPRRGSVCTCRATARSSWSLLPAGRASEWRGPRSA